MFNNKNSDSILLSIQEGSGSSGLEGGSEGLSGSSGDGGDLGVSSWGFGISERFGSLDVVQLVHNASLDDVNGVGFGSVSSTHLVVELTDGSVD